MRFDDMLATVIATDPKSPALRRNRWRQIADIVAQKGALVDRKIAARALAELARERATIALVDRIAAAHAVAGHARFAPVVAFFGHDVPDVASAMLRRVTLDDANWEAVVPALGPYGRSVLRARRDLSPAAVRALAAMGPNDLRLADRGATTRSAAQPAIEPADTAEADDNSGQIRDLVRRIEAFRESREKAAARRAEEPLGITSFRFATGANGAIHWVEGAPRGPLIGLEIGRSARGGSPGPDASAAGAFLNRGEIRDARIVLPPLPGFAGSWRFSAIPQFDRESGRFEGYRGTVRRARAGEDARNSPGQPSGQTEANGDALRQLVHELRTPLNAISGFAQIIEAQMMGPASDNYRAIAGKIAGDAGASLAMIDTLDLALAPSLAAGPEDAGCDLLSVAIAVEEELSTLLGERDVMLQVAGSGEAAPCAIAPGLAHRMVLRLLIVVAQAAQPGARIAVAVAGARCDGDAIVAIALPAPLDGASTEELRDPPQGDDGPAAERLALAFALRLVERAAQEVGGSLTAIEGKLILRLPGHKSVVAVDSEIG